MHPDRQRWNEKYRAGVEHETPDVALIMHQGRLARGRALDVAGGSGGNAAVLALAGWDVVMCDLSDEALVRARRRAAELKAPVRLVQADARHLPFRGPFDLVVVTYCHEPSIAPKLAGLLRPGGTLFYETFARGHRPEYCAAPDDLRRLFPLEEVLCREHEGPHGAASVFIGRRR